MFRVDQDDIAIQTGGFTCAILITKLPMYDNDNQWLNIYQIVGDRVLFDGMLGFPFRTKIKSFKSILFQIQIQIHIQQKIKQI